MAVVVVTRWITPDVEASIKVAKRAKANWLRNGAQDFRLSQIYSGEYTGQWIVSTTFADMAAFGKATNAMVTTLRRRKSKPTTQRLAPLCRSV